MKKYLIKFSIYVSILAVIILVLNALYIYKSENDIGAFVNDVPDDIQICNFGSSHGLYGFNYEDVKNYTCFNFALSAQRLTYDYRILQNYKDKIKKGATAFIVLSTFSLFGVPDTEREDFEAQNTRYYKFLPSNFIAKYEMKTYFFVNYLPIIGYGDFGNLINVFFRTHVDTWALETNAEDAVTHAEDRYQAHIVRIAKGKSENGSLICNQEYFDSLYGMINLLKEIGATPILITTPYTREYTDTIKKHDPKFFDEFYANINDIVKKTGIKYYDYSRDERYINDYSLFRDSDHMNRKGARIFTNNLLKEVLNIFP